MKARRLAIPGLVEITPLIHADARGYFYESFKDEWFRANVADLGFVQENTSLSRQIGTVRGLHFQAPPVAQGKLIRCIAGAIFDVAVDIRKGSPSYGQWIALELNAENAVQFWIPEGFAHGFLTLRPDTVICYKITAPYAPEVDFGLAWDDPDIGIAWPDIAAEAILSDKDRTQPRLADLPDYFSVSATNGA